MTDKISFIPPIIVKAVSESSYYSISDPRAQPLTLPVIGQIVSGLPEGASRITPPDVVYGKWVSEGDSPEINNVEEIDFYITGLFALLNNPKGFERFQFSIVNPIQDDENVDKACLNKHDKPVYDIVLRLGSVNGFFEHPVIISAYITR